MMKLIKFVIFISFFISCFQKITVANNVSYEVDKISKNLRCLICQGQSVYDSQSDFAISMKLVIIKKLEEGSTESQIYEYLKNQYGEWITYDPEFNKNTFFLWLFPIFIFVLGVWLIIKKIKFYKL